MWPAPRRRRRWTLGRLVLVAAAILTFFAVVDGSNDVPAQCQRPNTYEACR